MLQMLKSKDILSMRTLTTEEIELIFKEAESMKKVVLSDMRKTTHLTGKTVITLFYENSTRTRVSFELAAKYMGANAVNISASSSSVSKGETLLDTGRNIEAMGCDAIVVRHGASGAPHLLAKNLGCSILNAGDGLNEHPTQALLDMMTIKENKGSFEGLNVAIIGDILHSRVARSNIYGLIKMGANVRLTAPYTLMPVGIEETGAVVCETVKEAMDNADVVMGLRMQLERQKDALFPSVAEYYDTFGIGPDQLKYAKKNAIIMHPGPVNRGVEMATQVIDGESSVIIDQVTNGVAIRMACLELVGQVLKGGRA